MEDFNYRYDNELRGFHKKKGIFLEELDASRFAHLKLYQGIS
jgi:hypothetical protein